MYPTTKAGMEAKLSSMLQTKQQKATKHLQLIEQDIQKLTDCLVPSGNTDVLQFRNNGELKVAFNDKEYRLHDHALKQLATRYGIPQRYAVELTKNDWGRDLLRHTFHEHKINSDDKRLLFRTVDDQVRGVLSDSYRRLNSLDIYQKFCQASFDVGATIYDAFYSDIKTYINVVVPVVREFETANNGTIYSLFGAQIFNSDFGAGALSCQVWQMNLVCDNGMVSKSLVKQFHRGSKFPKGINFSLETYNYDTKAQASAIKDIVSQSLSEESIKQTIEIMQKASEVKIDMDKEFKKLDKVLGKKEVEVLDSVLKNNDPNQGLQGAPTKWKLAQAVTAVANTLNDEQRQRDLNEFAGTIVNYELV